MTVGSDWGVGKTVSSLLGGVGMLMQEWEARERWEAGKDDVGRVWREDRRRVRCTAGRESSGNASVPGV